MLERCGCCGCDLGLQRSDIFCHAGVYKIMNLKIVTKNIHGIFTVYIIYSQDVLYKLDFRWMKLDYSLVVFKLPSRFWGNFDRCHITSRKAASRSTCDSALSVGGPEIHRTDQVSIDIGQEKTDCNMILAPSIGNLYMRGVFRVFTWQVRSAFSSFNFSHWSCWHTSFVHQPPCLADELESVVPQVVRQGPQGQSYIKETCAKLPFFSVT